jgi:DNA polymerase-3 subunit alpha
LGYEKEVLGFYLSGHPLARFQSELNLFSTHRLDQLPAGNTAVRLAGMIGAVRRLVTKAKKEPYARCQFEDLHGMVDLVIFPRAYAGGVSQYLHSGEMVVVSGRLNRRLDEGPLEVLVEDMIPLSKAREQYVSELLVRMISPGLEDDGLEDLRQTLERYPGRCRVCLEIQTPPKGKVIVETDLSVKPSEALFQEIEQRLGRESWQITRVGR